MGTIMNSIASIVVGLVAVEHLFFMILEMFFWDKPLGLKSFGLTPEYARTTKVLAANQGLYNGFLAAGLVWSLILGTGGIAIFFLGCVIVAGVFGALTVRRTILFIQALPGAAALMLVLLSRMK